MLGQILGGVGLFLMGMWLMTDGLRAAAGSALKRILASWTSTGLRGFLTGAGLTTLVQSSSAVTVATIGFANAGFLTLTQAVWVVYGTNIGTTLTGWIVSIFGFKLEIAAFSLPLIGIGMLLRMTGGAHRRADFGVALAGFGLLFLGIDLLKEGFEGLSTEIALPGIAGDTVAGRLVYTGIGAILSLLMQSSSAATVVALTAVSSGLIEPVQAAALVVGANIGTTTTALLAAWGATSVARRVALVHVTFNLLGASFALVFLPQLVGLVHGLLGLVGAQADETLALALFHTVFNVIGVLLIWPMTPAIVRHLNRRFRSREEEAARLHYLDSTVLAVPSMAVEAAIKESRRLEAMATDAVRSWLDDPAATDRLPEAISAARAVGRGIADFLADLTTQPLGPEEARQAQDLMRAIQHCVAAIEDAETARRTMEDVDTVPPQRIEMENRIREVIAHPETMGVPVEAELLAHREEIKDELVRLVSRRALTIDSLDHALRGMNAELRMLRHLRKARDHLAAEQAPGGSPETAE
ncbi:Na/Pi cotransporter family protein [Amaricoccus macauensis]|uniref:Na/Pi cotransporter family protein n=1 Tax=Amaricoccus macauensis TaxID=57001 RepID=UPI003C7A6B23